MVKYLFFMSQVPSILAEVTHFNFLDTGTPEVGFLGSDGYLGKVGLIGVSGGSVMSLKPCSQVSCLQCIIIQITTPMNVTIDANTVNSGFEQITF